MSSDMINVTFRMNKQDKKAFEMIINSMGLNLSSAFNVFAKAVIRDNSIPFTLRGYEIPNAETLQSMRNIENNVDVEDVTIEQLIAEFEEKKKREANEH
ncbi:type II toxin-antitoxin system RelB/DinJ family antitoxin [Helicobacter saguini]|uniref:Type II toxin-antitoxin system RelB/DinJ family antitoxin n=1 Tax=Helicobacter saguini TaxID=1548018 RepID=A0A347VJ93_9HELI|nr:type II toxin-antitoxin system RelB/DinJ family antitoxin [Helicobacter saguini]MWV62999.1 type II toxin-antitoxin system RelB/DinJ family antitoxin [Helicobacter saguini]MWV66332.1 type II toxin-antitoxin system RelB/DinJ family antitoxin [Helicobacter saguini]MWV68684.1 type II toxin-antitoxin system RelB/DinJ family antitoxin [Helicobacter saguini]MWV71765.1 type II toxin-antitoxin system RelB/DinJ family antitoxin [Helicobacter saguini]TLD95797.1 type II toxin-antitoxin system RelB/DinJ